MFPPLQFQDNSRHLQVHQECLQDCRDIIQSIGQHLPAGLLHLNLLPVHLADTPFRSQRRDSSCQQNRGKQMWQVGQTCPHCWRYSTMNMMQLMRVRIHRTWAVQKANPQSAWSQLNPHWSNSPKGRARPNTVHSTSGTKYEWRCCSRRSIGPTSGGRSVWNRLKIDPWTARRQSKIIWPHSRDYCR